MGAYAALASIAAGGSWEPGAPAVDLHPTAADVHEFPGGWERASGLMPAQALVAASDDDGQHEET